MFDLHKLTQENIKFGEKILKQMMENYYSDQISDALLSVHIINKNLLPTYLSPAFHYNFYEKHIFTAPKIDKVESELNTAISSITFNSCLISIKSCLDRLVQIFHFYIKGVSMDSTFGHIKPSGKAAGLMQKIIENKETDNLCSLIYNNYELWIKEAVDPRNTIIHYNDLQVAYNVEFSKNDGDPLYKIGSVTPIHIHKNLEDAYDQEKHIHIDYNLLNSFCEKLYCLYNDVAKMLLERLPIK